MPNDPGECLYRATTHVLASMVSLSLKPLKREAFPGMEPRALQVQIRYKGERSGELGLVLERGLAKRIAAGMLGLQHVNDILDDMIDDAARELINVICGHFLTLMYGDQPVVEMSVPSIAGIDGTACRDLLGDPGFDTFMVEDSSPVLIGVEIHSAQAET